MCQWSHYLSLLIVDESSQLLIFSFLTVKLGTAQKLFSKRKENTAFCWYLVREEDTAIKSKFYWEREIEENWMDWIWFKVILSQWPLHASFSPSFKSIHQSSSGYEGYDVTKIFSLWTSLNEHTLRRKLLLHVSIFTSLQEEESLEVCKQWNLYRNKFFTRFPPLNECA